MSNRTLVELNHDYCPTSELDVLEQWAFAFRRYILSGDKSFLPNGVTFKHMRHHSEPEPQLLGPFCPKCSASMEPNFLRSSADSKSVVKMRCKGGKADELAYHEFSLATPQDFAQFFHVAAPAISPEPRCPECGSSKLHMDWNPSQSYTVQCLERGYENYEHFWEWLELSDFAQFFTSKTEGWVSVKERLPEINEEDWLKRKRRRVYFILTKFPDEVLEGEVLESFGVLIFSHCAGRSFDVTDVSYWKPRPLPAPPKEG